MLVFHVQKYSLFHIVMQIRGNFKCFTYAITCFYYLAR